MDFKKGNTYKLKANIIGIDINDINKIVFQFNDIQKTYIPDGESEGVEYDGENNFIIHLSQEETLKLAEIVKYEVAIKFNDGEVKRSVVYSTSSLATIIKEAI